MTHAEGPAYKVCPDCAEQVLAAARKCRYCGYRFDGRRRARGSWFDDLLGARHKGAADTTFEELLADWGTGLGEGEHVEWFRLVEVDQHPGYLLLTSERIVFFSETSATTHERTSEHRLSLLSDVRLAGRPGKRRLELWMGARGHVVEGPRSADFERLNDYLQRVIRQNRRVPASRGSR